MAVKKLKPITPGQRGRTVNSFETITTSKPEKSLLIPKKRSGGRNSQGRMTMKFRGEAIKRSIDLSILKEIDLMMKLRF